MEGGNKLARPFLTHWKIHKKLNPYLPKTSQKGTYKALPPSTCRDLRLTKLNFLVLFGPNSRAELLTFYDFQLSGKQKMFVKVKIS